MSRSSVEVSTCTCPTRVAHPEGCDRAARGGSVVAATLCQFCSDGHNEVDMKYRVSKDTPVGIVVEADDAAKALEATDQLWIKIWDRLDRVANELQEELGVEVVIGFAYDDTDVEEET